MVIFLDGGNVTWTSYTPIDHVQRRISNQGLHGRNLFFQVFFQCRDLKCSYITGHNILIFYFFLFFQLHQHMLPLVQQ